jgi:hypothetical protein
MFQSFGNMFGGKAQRQPDPAMPPMSMRSPMANTNPDRKPTYSKVFRWKLPEGETQQPNSVEVVGSFTDWQRVPLLHDGKVQTWHVTIPNIPGNKTHHYMLLVDGNPAQDKGCDGYALPQGAVEERYTIQTARGPRLFMLFAQTK